MALQSHSNSFDELESSNADCSSEATPTEVYCSPLGINGGISGIYLSNEELNPINLLGDAVADRAPRNIILNSEGTRIGDDVYVTVQGPANFTVNHVGPGCQPTENSAQKDASCPLRQHEESVRKKSATTTSRRTCIFVTFFVSVVLLLSAIILWVSLGKRYNPSVTEDPRATTTETPDLGWFIPRETWGGVAPKNDPIPTKPAILAIVKHTGGNTCWTKEACRARVREIQKKHMKIQKLPDISYNFLIGGDGKIYIGRGFAVQNGGRNDSLDMAFIGNFTENVPTGAMLSLGRKLLILAPREQGLNYSKYFVVNHNQTEPTDSPGEELFKAVARGYNHYSSAVCYRNSSESFVMDYNCPANSHEFF